MTRTYWQAGLYRGGREYDCDFPNRATAAEALADAREAMGRFTPAEREHVTYQAIELRWVAPWLAESTGRIATEDPQ